MKKQILILCGLLALTGCGMGRPCCDKLKENYKPVVHFAFDSSELTSKDKHILQEIPHKLKDCPKLTLKITGYADDIGTPEYNMNLGKMRAEAVEEYLETLNIQSNRIHTQSMGEKNPVACNKTEEGRAKNRRATIELN